MQYRLNSRLNIAKKLERELVHWKRNKKFVSYVRRNG